MPSTIPRTAEHNIRLDRQIQYDLDQRLEGRRKSVAEKVPRSHCSVAPAARGTPECSDDEHTRAASSQVPSSVGCETHELSSKGIGEHVVADGHLLIATLSASSFSIDPWALRALAILFSTTFLYL